MTAKKRFHYYPKSQMIIDVFTGKRYFGHDAICKLLNILYEENEELEQQLTSILKLTKKIEDYTYDIKIIGDLE